MLKRAGLDRVNMSVDSLRPERIARSRGATFAFDPDRAALAAERAGLGPMKLNMVVMRGVNDDEVEDFARLTLDHPWHVRFIELMPVGEMRESHLGSRRAQRRDSRTRVARSADLHPDAGPARGNGPAAYYRVCRRAGERSA